MSDHRPATLGDLDRVHERIDGLEERTRRLEFGQIRQGAWWALLAFLGSVIGSAVVQALIARWWLSGRGGS